MPIRRRTLLAAAASAAAAMGCGEPGSPPKADKQAARVSETGSPNILMLCIDDLRDWVGYMNRHPGVHTPNIDRLRGESLSFDRAYCSVPVCIASRGSALWGLSPESVGLDGIRDESAYTRLTQSKELQPLPYWLAQAGYETISTGKVFHWGKGSRRFWDIFQPYPEIPVTFGEHGTLFDYGVLEPTVEHADQVAANFAKAQLGRKPARPWFMAIGLFQPHVPWRLPQWAFDLHPLDKVVLPEVRPDDLDDIPAEGVRFANFPSGSFNGKPYNQHDLVVQSGLWAQHVQAYLAACSHTDAMVGQILDALAASAHADNTAIVLWSDHGYHLGEKLHWRKMALWEQATRVPLLLKVPGRTEPGSEFTPPVSLLDLAPTVMDIANVAAPNQFQGKTLLSISDEEARQRPPHMIWENASSIRSGKWRWTRYSDGGQELYDHSVDPEEHHNLLGREGTLEGGLEALMSKS